MLHVHAAALVYLLWLAVPGTLWHACQCMHLHCERCAFASNAVMTLSPISAENRSAAVLVGYNNTMHSAALRRSFTVGMLFLVLAELRRPLSDCTSYAVECYYEHEFLECASHLATQVIAIASSLGIVPCAGMPEPN